LELVQEVGSEGVAHSLWPCYLCRYWHRQSAVLPRETRAGRSHNSVKATSTYADIVYGLCGHAWKGHWLSGQFLALHSLIVQLDRHAWRISMRSHMSRLFDEPVQFVLHNRNSPSVYKTLTPSINALDEHRASRSSGKPHYLLETSEGTRRVRMQELQPTKTRTLT
jgi:hypothetical protein